jgi:uncharacterized protein
MRTYIIISVFSVILVIYFFVNFYIYKRGLQAIPQDWHITTWYTILFFTIAFSYIISRFLERFWISPLSDILVWVGSFWLAAMCYLFFIVLFLDIIRLFNHLFAFLPAFIFKDYARTKLIILFSSLSFVIIILLAGYINILNPRVKNLSFDINKNSSGLKQLNIALLTDIHLGTIFTKSRLDKLVEEVNGLNPDIVILGGDIVDEDLAPVLRKNLGQSLLNIKSKYGTYAIMGNHEYIGGAEKAAEYIKNHNIRLLRDSMVKVNDEFYLIGREDRSRTSFGGSKRKTLEELISGIDLNLPVILLDHQPFDLKNSAIDGIDVQFSGHTHHGQLWPFNFITNMIYEISYGYKKINNTHFYVSLGVGTWGPPIRTGHRPEIVNVKLIFR